MQGSPFNRRGARADLPAWALKPGKAETAISCVLVLAFASALVMLVLDSGTQPILSAEQLISASPTGAGVQASAPPPAASSPESAQFALAEQTAAALATGSFPARGAPARCPAPRDTQ